jgi:hypothetical protein
MATTTFAGIYATTKSYDPTGFYGEETSRVDINTTPLATSATFSQPGSAFSGNNVLGTVTYGGTSFSALASRPIKVGGVVKGFYVWVDNEAIWSGNGTALDRAYILSLDNAYFAANSRISSSSDKVDSALNSVLASQASGSTDPITDPTTDPVADPSTDPITDPTTDPVADPSTDPITDPTPDPNTSDPGSEPPTADDTSEQPAESELLTPETDSGGDNDTTANNNPELRFIAESGEEDNITIEDTTGTELIEDEHYTITEVVLEDKPGSSAYLVKLVDADPDTGGDQPFGDHFQGDDTGNKAGTGDGTYMVFLKGEAFDSFTIATPTLKEAERLDCLDAIYGKDGQHALESKLYGHRIDQKRGTDGDDNLLGNSKQNNTLKGRDGSDLLNAVGDRLTGASFNPADFATDQVDILIGGKGPDTFQLADIAGSFYGARGISDRAVIKDFSTGDRLLLYGQASDYALSPISAGQVELSRNGDLIAILRGKGIAGLDLTDSSQIAYF